MVGTGEVSKTRTQTSGRSSSPNMRRSHSQQGETSNLLKNDKSDLELSEFDIYADCGLRVDKASSTNKGKRFVSLTWDAKKLLHHDCDVIVAPC